MGCHATGVDRPTWEPSVGAALLLQEAIGWLLQVLPESHRWLGSECKGEAFDVVPLPGLAAALQDGDAARGGIASATGRNHLDQHQRRAPADDRGHRRRACRPWRSARRQYRQLHTRYQAAVQRLASVLGALRMLQAPPAEAAARRDELRGQLGVWPTSDPRLRGVAVLDSTGTVVVATESALTGVNLAYRDFVQQGLRGVTVISDVSHGGDRDGGRAHLCRCRTHAGR